MAIKELIPAYSGERSEEFWDRVATLEGKEAEGAYMLGCALQDLEGRVLKYMAYAESLPKGNAGRKVSR